MKSWINNGNVSSIDELAQKLPTPIQQNYIPVLDSGSRHLANAEAPRILHFWYPDPSEREPLYLAYSGDPKDPNYQILEVIYFHDPTAKKHNPELNDPEASYSWQFRAVDFSQDKPEANETTPASCADCHGDDHDPIFERYPGWPGMIRSDSEEITEKESQWRAEFKTNAAATRRYRHLDREWTRVHSLEDVLFLTERPILDFIRELQFQDSKLRQYRITDAMWAVQVQWQIYHNRDIAYEVEKRNVANVCRDLLTR